MPPNFGSIILRQSHRFLAALKFTALLGLFLCPALTRAEVRLTDTPADIVDLLKPFLPAETINDAGDVARLERQIRKEFPEILATEGYFNAEISLTPGEKSLRIKVVPGPRTRVRKVDIEVEGDLDDARRQSLIAAWPLKQGMPFRQADWNRAKQFGLSTLLASDFRGAELNASRAAIDPETQSADLSVTYTTGASYRFGDLTVEGLERYDMALISRYNRSIEPGKGYSEPAITELQNALQGSGYFASVRIETAPDEAEPDADGHLRLPVKIYLRERQPHRVSFGAGASSNTGARVEVLYSTLNLFSRAWKLNTGLRLEERKQTFYSDLYLPPAQANYQPSIGFAFEKTDISNLQTERRALSIQRAQQRGSVTTKYSIDWQSEDKLPQGATETHSKALALDGQWVWHRLDSVLNPRKGMVVQTKLGVASEAMLSDQDFVRTYVNYMQYFPIGERDTLTFRVELGYTFADSRAGIPQQYLFRAGGTNSVRGYAYNSLGVREGEAIVGGRYLGTSSVEYTRWFSNAWGGALFVDAGNAGDNLDELKPKYGAGFGARWRSPAGPIAVDLGWGEDRNSPRLHFFVAIPF